MVPDTPRRGWRISEVESLLGLARRDIQRCCYTGRGGVGILEPEDSAWGRRTYNVPDLAQLFLVRQYRRQGLSLPEVKQVLDDHCATGRTVRDLLAIQVDRLTDQADEVLGQLLQAQALLAAVSGQPGAVEAVVERQVQVRTALQPGACGDIAATAGPRGWRVFWGRRTCWTVPAWHWRWTCGWGRGRPGRCTKRARP